MKTGISDEKLVAVVDKNSREQFRVTTATFMGYKIVSFRVWYRKADTYQPSRQGVAIRAERLDEVIEALTKARTADVVPFPKPR